MIGWSRTLLAVTGVVFVGIGAGFLLVPTSWAAWVEVALPTPVARIDLRATYGGFDLAFGAFLLLCALRAKGWLRPGLWASALALAGFAAGRIIGMVVEGAVPAKMAGLLAVEVALAVLSAVALSRIGPDPQP